MVVLTLAENLTEQSRTAQVKTAGATHPFRYLVAAMLAGVYIGVGVVLMLSTAGPFLEAGNPGYQLVSGVVFAGALTLVVFAGAELATSAMMILTQGVATRAIRFVAALSTLALCVVGNLLGSMAFAWMTVQSKILESNPAANEMLRSMLDHKAHESVGEMFFRGVLCNLLVCAAIWACGRLKSEAGKAIIIFWAVFAFIASGFEHVVANMTTFSLGLFSGGMTTWSAFGHNALWVGLGNLVGGALVVGIGYVIVAGRAPAATAPITPSRTTQATTTWPAAASARTNLAFSLGSVHGGAHGETTTARADDAAATTAERPSVGAST